MRGLKKIFELSTNVLCEGGGRFISTCAFPPQGEREGTLDCKLFLTPKVLYEYVCLKTLGT